MRFASDLFTKITRRRENTPTATRARVLNQVKWSEMINNITVLCNITLQAPNVAFRHKVSGNTVTQSLMTRYCYLLNVITLPNKLSCWWNVSIPAVAPKQKHHANLQYNDIKFTLSAPCLGGVNHDIINMLLYQLWTSVTSDKPSHVLWTGRTRQALRTAERQSKKRPFKRP